MADPDYEQRARSFSPAHRVVLDEWHAAVRAWASHGEPAQGPVFERMNAARRALLDYYERRRTGDRS